MPKLSIKATELVDTDVNFVSLVKRGANRIPFRITKEDEPMLDLHKIGRRLFKQADPQPEVVAAIFEKGTDSTRLAQLFKQVGLDPKTFVKTEQDGIVTVAKEGYDQAEDAMVLRISKDVGLVVSGLKKAFQGYDFESTDFAEVMATGSFCSSVSMATDMLQHTIGSILYEAETPDQAADSIQKAIDEYKQYTVTLTKGLPVHAFKMDGALVKGEAGEEAPPARKPVEEPAAEDGTNTGDGADELEKTDTNGTGAGAAKGKGTGTDPHATEDDKKKTKVNAKPGGSTTQKAEVKGLPQPQGFEPGDDDGFAAPPSDSQGASARAAADDKKMKLNGGTSGSSIPDGNSGVPVRKNEGDNEAGKFDKQKLPEEQSGAGAQQGNEPDAAALHKAENDKLLAAMTALQKSFTEAFGAMKAEVGSLSDRVDSVASLAQKTDAALNGTVFNEAGGDGRTKVGKADEKDYGSGIPLLDTAFNRRDAA
ncbi:hypothetical protein [Sinorhizobium fredii]|uniref:hypothetical protein n=1 Tax=Rhizobium fredii TaxID=380 RepID=UPI001297740B|nr:hypothetical protein [Sinorhizobium fredii]MQW94037.1 hypothetical protein [Sinorhizobium fredii]